MEYRIEKRDAFRVVGISAPLDRDIEKNFESVPKLWGKAAAEGVVERLLGLMDTPLDGILGVSACGDEEPWRYYIAAASTKPAPGLEEYNVPAALWAVFPGSGPGSSIQSLEQRIVTEWLPSSGYEYGKGPDIEVYLNADPQNSQYEVWIPVVKK